MFSKFRRTEIMSDFKINLTTAEAVQIVAALGFVRRNLAVNAKTLQWSFVGGECISYDISALIQLEDVICRFNESIEEAIETHPFNPYFNHF